MIAVRVSRDQVVARLTKYLIECVAAVALAVVIVCNLPGAQ